MSRRPARFTVVDLKRAIQAAGANGSVAVAPDGTITIVPDIESGSPAKLLPASKAVTTGQIYFVQSETTLAIKIGFSTNTKKRLKALQTGSADKLSLLGVRHYSTMADERALHHKFRKDRVGGEWFRPTPELLRYIKKASGE